MGCPDYFPDINGDESLLKLNIEEFTHNVVHAPEFTVIGEGLFDVMMNTATKHLKAQFDGNRIRDEDYADAYVAIYQATLQQAVQIWLNKGLTEHQARLLECQARFACAQAETECHRPALVDAQTALTVAQKLTEDEKPANVRATTELVIAQKATEDKKPAQVEAQTGLITAQTATEGKKPANIEAQTNLTNAQKLTEDKKPALLTAQTNKEIEETKHVTAQTALVKEQTNTQVKQTAHVAAQTGLVNAQTATEQAQPAHISAQTGLANAQANTQKEQANNLKAQTVTEGHKPNLIDCQAQFYCSQADKEDQTIELLKQQIELAKEQLKLSAAQIAETDAKKQLYKRQIEGFDEDYKYKILKILMDSWAVGFSVAKDSFEASGIPATMQKVTIDDLYNTYIRTDLDRYTYGRDPSVLS